MKTVVRWLRRGLIHAVGRTGLLHEAIGYIDESNSKQCHRSSASRGATFSPTARVGNWSDTPESIIVGRQTMVCGELLVYPPAGEIVIGDHCYIGGGSRLWAMLKISLGNNVLISHNVNIIDNNSHEIDHLQRSESNKKMLFKGGVFSDRSHIAASPVVIMDDVWVGLNSIILKGVRIGARSIVAAGSVVTKDVPESTLVAGNPARIIRSLS